MAKVTRVLMEWEHSGGDIAICPATDEEVAVYLRRKGYEVKKPKLFRCVTDKHGPLTSKCRRCGRVWRWTHPAPLCLKHEPEPALVRCEFDYKLYLSEPAQHKCRYCGQMWSVSEIPPVCNEPDKKPRRPVLPPFGFAWVKDTDEKSEPGEAQ